MCGGGGRGGRKGEFGCPVPSGLRGRERREEEEIYDNETRPGGVCVCVRERERDAGSLERFFFALKEEEEEEEKTGGVNESGAV